MKLDINTINWLLKEIVIECKHVTSCRFWYLFDRPSCLSTFVFISHCDLPCFSWRRNWKRYFQINRRVRVASYEWHINWTSSLLCYRSGTWQRRLSYGSPATTGPLQISRYCYCSIMGQVAVMAMEKEMVQCTLGYSSLDCLNTHDTRCTFLLVCMHCKAQTKTLQPGRNVGMLLFNSR